MKRREFITFLSAAVAWPLAAHAQQSKLRRLGFLWDSPAVFPEAMEAFRHELRELGYVDGRNIVVEYRWAEGNPERMREMLRSWSASRSTSLLRLVPFTPQLPGRPRQRSPLCFSVMPIRLGAATSLVFPVRAAISPAFL